MIKIKPFLKWAGSKYGCIDKILTSLPTANRLIEPFTGSGAVFINSEYPEYLLADGNPDLISLFEQIKNEGLPFIDFCQQYFKPENNDSTVYYTLRKLFNETEEPRLRAALFLYLNRHGYNGLCRYNNSGIYNVPFGQYIKPYFPRKELLVFHQKSQNAQFTLKDFRETFDLAKIGDVIYCDPPYVPLSKTANFSAYMLCKFSEQDQIDLAMLAQRAAERGIIVIISNHDTEFTRHHYQNSHIVSFSVPRYISCDGQTRRPVKEILATFGNKRVISTLKKSVYKD